MICRRCGEEGNFSGHNLICNVCRAKDERERFSASPEMYLKRVHSVCQSRAKQAGIPFDLTYEQLLSLWKKQKGRCALSGVILTHHLNGKKGQDLNASLDRISPGGPYTLKNVQLVAGRVNTIKNDLDNAGLYWWIRAIYEQQGMKT